MQHMAPTGPQQPSMVPLGCTYLRVLPWCLGRVGGPCCRSDWVLACLLPCCRLVPGLWPVAGLQSGCCVGLWLGAGLCSGFVPALFRLCSGLFRLCSGFVPACSGFVPACSGFVPALFRLCSGFVPALFRLCSGFVPACSGFVPALFRLCSGLFWASWLPPALGLAGWVFFCCFNSVLGKFSPKIESEAPFDA